MYCFADTIVELFVTSSSTTSSDEVTPRFLSSTMAASPEGTAAGKYEDGCWAAESSCLDG